MFWQIIITADSADLVFLFVVIGDNGLGRQKDQGRSGQEGNTTARFAAMRRSLLTAPHAVGRAISPALSPLPKPVNPTRGQRRSTSTTTTTPILTRWASRRLGSSKPMASRSDEGSACSNRAQLTPRCVVVPQVAKKIDAYLDEKRPTKIVKAVILDSNNNELSTEL